jgi:acyl-ACP thioesterase
MRNPVSDLLWTDEFPVRLYEADSRGSLAVGSLCNYLQEAAGNHAGHLGVSVGQLMERGLTWVLSRLHVCVARLPRWRDEVTIETWPSGLDEMVATRDFRLHDGGGRSIGRARRRSRSSESRSSFT